VLRRIFASKREEAAGCWIRLHNEELRNVYNILARKPEEKRPLEKRRCRYEGNIRMDLTEVMSEVVDWMRLAQDRDQWWTLVNTAMNLRIT